MKKIILVAGGTASGKTMIAELLKEKYEKNNISCTLMSMDNYYMSIDDLPEKNGIDVNWDSPKVIDWKKFIFDVNELYLGKNVFKKKYDFNMFKHPGNEEKYESNDVIIIEGLFSLYRKEIRNLAIWKIFVHCDDDIRLIRRINRDSNSRYKLGFNLNVFMDKWINEIKPMHKKFVKPTNDYADLIIKNNNKFEGIEKNRLMKILDSLVVK